MSKDQDVQDAMDRIVLIVQNRGICSSRDIPGFVEVCRMNEITIDDMLAILADEGKLLEVELALPRPQPLSVRTRRLYAPRGTLVRSREGTEATGW